MKKNNIIALFGATIAITLKFGSCSDVLDEHPRSVLTVDFKGTDAGMEGSLANLYTSLRNMYGQGYYLNACETGTDEFTFGASADANFKDADHSEGAASLSASNCRADVIWSPMINNINSASQMIEEGVNASPSIVAEAYFFRAFNYFILVQTFGGVPLDLGSGELKSNTADVRQSVRNTVAEVYTKCIFPDLEFAVENLPSTPRLSGAVAQNVARLFLSKAYLTYGWWLENPNNKPTYPAVDGKTNGPRTDPNGKTPAEYFQMAYDVALAAIKDPGPYALQNTFYDMCIASNERNPEMMLWADHTEESEALNGASLVYNGGEAPANFAFWMINWNYPTISAYTRNDTLTAKGGMYAKCTPVKREAKQGYGRPWTRMAPTYNVFSETFADEKDSRRDATFQTTIHANWHVGKADAPATHKNANDMDVAQDGIILTFVPKAIEGTVYDKANGALGLGVAPGRADYVVDPEHISRKIFPGPYKFSGFSQESDDVKGTRPYTTLGVPNANNVRPYYLAKFSEFYLIAAEAAVKGASGEKTARDLVNVLRARAGKWNYSVAEDKAITADYSADLVAATPENIDMKYIMLERSREFFGEGYRRLDLIRTQMWEELAGSYKICGSSVGDWTLEEFKRDIKPEYYLSPIPIGQLDGLEMSAEEKAAYQNPGY